MTGKRQQLVMVLHVIAQGQMTAVVAATVLGVSEQQVWRLLAAYRRAGAAALQHGNTGPPPAHTISAAVRQWVVMLTTTTYQGCNQQHLGELLAEREGIVLSRSSLLRILHAEGIGAAHQSDATGASPAARPLPAYGDARADPCQSARLDRGARTTPDAGGGDR